jgi:protein-arginine kinase activator protein McsA
MLCSICNQQPATIHITTIVEGVQTRQDFCEACAPSAVPDLKAWTKKMAGKPCDYCGQPARAGAGPRGKERFWCQACAESFGAILQQVYAEMPRPTDPTQTMEWIERATEEADRRMRARKDQP